MELRLNQSVPTGTLKTLNDLAVPAKLLIPKGTTLNEALELRYGTERADLIKIVEEMNRGVAKSPERPPGLNDTSADRTVLAPGIPPLSTTQRIPVPQGTDVEKLAKLAYGKLTRKVIRSIDAANPNLDTWSTVNSSGVLLPDVPGRGVVRFKSTNPLKGSVVTPGANPEGSPASGPVNAQVLQEVSSMLALTRSLAGVSAAEPSIDYATLETSSTLISTKDGGQQECESLVTNQDIKRDWYVDAIAARKLSKSDLPGFAQYTEIAVLDSGLVSSDLDFAHIVQRVPDSGSATPRFKLGIDVTDPSSVFPEDQNSEHHGTHVAGIATGRHLIPQLDVGLRQFMLTNFRLLVVKLFAGQDLVSPMIQLNSALSQITSVEPFVYNMSFNSPMTPELKERFSAENGQRHVYVIAAGNGVSPLNPDNGRFPDVFEPSGDYANIFQSTLIVAALSPGGAVSATSRWGDNVEVAAPGECIESNGMKGGKLGAVYLTGTSQAAPFVAMTAALLHAKHENMGSRLVKQRILESCDWDPSLDDKVRNGCRLNVAKALATTVDVIEVKPTMDHGKSSALIRGTIQKGTIEAQGGGKFPVDPSRPQALRRIWFGDVDDGTFKVLLRNKAPVKHSLLKDPNSVIQMDSADCPAEYRVQTKCTIPVNDIRDVLLSDPYAIADQAPGTGP